MPALVRSDKIHIFRLEQAILVPVNESGMEGDGQIVTVLLLYHIAGMEGVAVAE